MPEWIKFERSGVRLMCRDFGGDGPPVLMLSGLAGHTGEWGQFAGALGVDFRRVALDQRGHGRSERTPRDLSREAFVADVAVVIERLGLRPVTLVGQSMGGNTAYLTAAAHPDLVRALVVIEASPDGPIPELPERIRRWLDGWPVPFADEAHAREFFASQQLAPDAWAAGLERMGDGLWPSFDKDVMVTCIAEVSRRDYWAEWSGIRCPTLLVRGEHGYMEAAHYDELARRLPAATSATIAGARHDVHLDEPQQLADLVRRLLEQA